MKIVRTLAAFALLAAATGPALAQPRYPSKPVRMIVAFPPGQATDIIARLLADELGRAMGQQFIVENRAGGDSIPGTMAGKNAPGDGYTLTFGTSSSFAVNSALFDKLPYDPPTDFAMVHGVFTVPWVIVAHPSQPFNTLAEMVTAAKKSPDKLQWGYGASSLQLGAELFKLHTGAQIAGVPYKGSGPATTDLIGGHIGMLIDTVAATVAHVRAGKMKALATLGPKRVPLLPDTPTAVEQGYPEVQAEGWGGVAVPKATPTEIVDQLSSAIGRILADPAIQQKILDRGTVPDPRGPKEWSAFVASEVTKWTDIARRAKVRATQ